ncbi:hypothetical protein GCM10020295_57380 [Streptomyces cinereospinus]
MNEGRSNPRTFSQITALGLICRTALNIWGEHVARVLGTLVGATEAEGLTGRTTREDVDLGVAQVLHGQLSDVAHDQGAGLAGLGDPFLVAAGLGPVGLQGLARSLVELVIEERTEARALNAQRQAASAREQLNAGAVPSLLSKLIRHGESIPRSCRSCCGYGEKFLFAFPIADRVPVIT